LSIASFVFAGFSNIFFATEPEGNEIM